MRAVNWLHISDMHLRESESSAQEAVLSAMLEDIRRRCSSGLAADFVLVTGDLAFSGEESQYALVGSFFRKLAATTELPHKMIFCVPGNHDVQRKRHKMCFIGARQHLQSENEVYALLEDAEERNVLLARQSNFLRFQDTFFKGQQRTRTADDLGYVSYIEIEDLRIAILGLNSAWLAEGGNGDERRLLLGEYQVVNAIDIAKRSCPHIIIGMQHHPFDLLRRFDQRATQRRLEDACHFLHFGHLHTPEACDSVIHTRHCLSLAAGASYESRVFRNAYSVVTLDTLAEQTNTIFVQYDPTEGVFAYEAKGCYSHEIDASAPCPAGELAKAIGSYCSDAIQISHYLASLLLGDMSDVAVRVNGKITLGTLELLKKHGDSELEEATKSFLTVGIAVKLLCGCKSLSQILAGHGEPLISYVGILRTLCQEHAGFSEQLTMRNKDASSLATTGTFEPFRYTLGLLDDLLAEGDWVRLREQAQRCAQLEDSHAAHQGRRMLALCLAQSSERADLLQAARLYRELTESAHVKADDWAALATLLADDGAHAQAKAAVLQGIREFPKNTQGFVEVGMRLVTATGDTEFREQLRASSLGEILT